MWLLAFVPVYLAVALLIARFCRLNTRLDETMSDYFSVLESERRAEVALAQARKRLVQTRAAAAAAASVAVTEARSEEALAGGAVIPR